MYLYDRCLGRCVTVAVMCSAAYQTFCHVTAWGFDFVVHQYMLGRRGQQFVIGQPGWTWGMSQTAIGEGQALFPFSSNHGLRSIPPVPCSLVC